MTVRLEIVIALILTMLMVIYQAIKLRKELKEYRSDSKGKEKAEE